MVDEESLKLTEVNIMFIGQGENEFKRIISDLADFLTSFSLKKDDIYDDKLKFTGVMIRKEETIEEILNNDEDFLEQEEELIINISNFQSLPQLKENSKEYKEFDEMYKKIDFCFVFNSENQIALNKIYNYSNGNCIFFSLTQNFDENIKTKYPKGKIYDILTVKEENQDDGDLKTFFFENFLKDIKNKFDMFLIFEKYSVEKSIVKFLDYYQTINEYSKIKDEQELIELFNNFEKFSFNNDYADITIILLQIMANSNDMLKNDFSFNVKSLNCTFCTERMDICEFDTNVKSFLCYRCKLNKNLYQSQNQNQ
jgi:hypothetical protein